MSLHYLLPMSLHRTNEAMGVAGENSQRIEAMFFILETPYEKMQAAAEALLKGQGDTGGHVQTLLEYEGDFLKQMNAIVFQYDAEASQRVVTLGRVQIGVTFAVLLLIALIGFGIFTPAIRGLREEQKRREQAQSERATLADQLEDQNEHLKVALEEAQSAERLKTEFLSTMSHEIRTPMNGTLGMTELLQMTELTAEQQEYVNTIRTSGESLLHMINDILDYSVLEAGKLELNWKPMNLRQILEDVLAILGPEALQKNVELTYTIAPGTPETIRGDALRVRQVVQNLLGNAVKFTEQGDVKLTVCLVALDDGVKQMQIQVQDTGIGISPERIATLFDRFTQADASNSRKYGGTGLGLAICQRVVKAFGGTIDVESEVEKGSIFTVRWPLEYAPEASGKAVAAKIRPLEGQGVLVVIPPESTRYMVEAQCTRWGGRVRAVASATEGLRFLSSNEAFDWLLMDEAISDMTWDVFSVQAQSMKAHAPLKRILMSAKPPQDEEADAYFEARVQKPVIISRLLSAFEQVVKTER